MRLQAVFCLVIGATMACADRLISIPIARKQPFGDLRLEYDGAPSGVFHEIYADYGVGKSFELAYRLEGENSDSAKSTFDFAYNLIAPLAGFSPGVSFGVQDALANTSDGRRFYAAITSRQIYSTDGGDAPGDVTIGVYIGTHESAFVGTDLPLSPNIRFLLEDNGYRVSGGIEFRPIASTGIRFITRGDRPMISVTSAMRF